MRRYRYEYYDYSKENIRYWEIAIQGCTLKLAFGSVKGEQRTGIKNYSTTSEAAEAAKFLIEEKKAKGYVRAPITPLYRIGKRERRENTSSDARATSVEYIDELISLSNEAHDLERKWHDARFRYEVEEPEFVALMDRIIHEPLIESIWNKYQIDSVPDGVAWSDHAVPETLKRKLNFNFTRMLRREPADYHPGSGRQVRDLVHPSLFPYVKGLSKTNPNLHVDLAGQLDRSGEYRGEEDNSEIDFWGRPYEDSDFQWLPTPFKVSKNGKVRILSYINNLDRDRYSIVYKHLASLFELALPLFESVAAYVRNENFYTEDCEIEEKPKIKLRGRELQVITKMVEYQIEPRKGLKGVWHLEGMSHENILATAVYVLRRDKTLRGGEIQFRRPYTLDESNSALFEMAHNPPSPFRSAVEEKGVIPNGTLSTPENRLFVFPNCHIHRLSKMKATWGKGTAKRRVIVFWLVHPDFPIISTREVPPQQDIIDMGTAKEIRRDLMKERKLHKQSLNPRTVSLCEH